MFWGNPGPRSRHERANRSLSGAQGPRGGPLRLVLALLLAAGLAGRVEPAQGQGDAAGGPAPEATVRDTTESPAPASPKRPPAKKRGHRRHPSHRRTPSVQPQPKDRVARAHRAAPKAKAAPRPAPDPAAASALEGPPPGLALATPAEAPTGFASPPDAGSDPAPATAAPGAALAHAEEASAEEAAPAPRRTGPLAPGIAPPPEPLPPMAPAEVWQHLPVTRDVLQPAPVYVAAGDGPRAAASQGLFGLVSVGPSHPGIPSPLRVDYTFDPELERRVFDILEGAHVRLGHVIVLDPESGRILAYASTDVEDFPPNRLYPAASLIKVVTAAAALHYSRNQAEAPCRFLGSPYILTPQRIDPPRRGKQISLEEALATSNNQCFAQLAVHAVGPEGMVDAIRRFGLLREPAPGHPAGMIDPGTDRFDLGRLGCGLWGTWITPLHAAEIAATLAHGRQVDPYWVERVTDASGRRLRLAERRAPRQVLTPALATELRSMLVETTVSGTARRGFHTARGASLLGPVQAAGKTGSLSGTDPVGRYEWFAGVAPADDPKVAIAVVVVNQQRYWAHASRVAGQVLQAIFCPDGRCTPEAAERWTRRAPGEGVSVVRGASRSRRAPVGAALAASEGARPRRDASPETLPPVSSR